MPWSEEEKRKYMKKYHTDYNKLRIGKKVLKLAQEKLERQLHRKKLQEHINTIFTGGSDCFGYVIENEGLVL